MKRPMGLVLALGLCAALAVVAGCGTATGGASPSGWESTGAASAIPDRGGRVRLFRDTFGDPAPEGIAVGPDGAIWFTDSGNDVIGRVTGNGDFTMQTVAGGEVSNGITAGPDGNLWFTLEENPGRIGRITTAGVVTLFADGGGSFPQGITTGSDGALWFAESNGRVGRMTTTGRVKHFDVAPSDATLKGIVSGPDGALWVTQNVVNGSRVSNQVIRLTTRGKKSSYTVGAGPDFICVGPDQALWFTEEGSAAIGRLTIAGAYREFSLNDRYATPSGIAAGLDGALWFTNYGDGIGIGRMTTSGQVKFYNVPGNPEIEQITLGPGGAMWFTSTMPPAIGRITTP